MMHWVRKAPTTVVVTVVVAVAIVILGFLGGFVVLTLEGRDTTEYRGLVNLAMNSVTVLLAGIAAIGSTSGAKSASNTEEQTNGTLTSRDQTIEQLRADLDYARRHGGR